MIGANIGYKFVFGNGFSLEPTLGIEYGIFYAEPFPSIGVKIGYAWGGGPRAAPAPRPAAAQPATGTGLYLGIIGFNDRITVLDIGLLNAGNMDRALRFIDGLQKGPATGLYYAVDKGIDMLSAARLPNDLANVAIVTFTDGLDNASIDLNTRYNSRNEYRDFLANRINQTSYRPRGGNEVPLQAHVVGILGGDVADRVAFTSGLNALASLNTNPPPERFVYFDEMNPRNFSSVYTAFGKIASQLYSESARQDIRLRITGGYDDGTRIRFTFDNVTDASRSNLYIDGIYRRRGTNRSLENIAVRGLTHNSGEIVNGTISQNIFVNFTFLDTKIAGTNNTLNLARTQQNPLGVQQWEYIESLGTWQRNSEFGREEDAEPIINRTSAIIMLVLDCTDSLDADGANMFNQMKDAAKDFIRTLVSGTR